MDENALIAEYERLRRKAHELHVQAEYVDRRLTEIERLLPDEYTYPGDPTEEEFKRLLSVNRRKHRSS